MSAKNVVIIIGAGASHGCASPSFHKLIWNQDFRPPLAKDLFIPNKSTAGILQSYSGANALSQHIRSQADVPGIEVTLRDLMASGDSDVRKAANHIPLYLRHLFEGVSQNYLPNMSTNYDLLFTRILLLGIERVTFISLNYDTFLEAAIERHFRKRLVRMEDYLDFRPGWSLIKLHGSCNWYRKVIGARLDAVDYMSALDIPELRESLSRTVVTHSEAGEIFGPNRVCHYPALVVPVVDKYDVSCPPSHYQFAVESVRSATHIFSFGFSFKDDDVLTLLAHAASLEAVSIINGSEAHSSIEYQRPILERLERLCPNVYKVAGAISPFLNYDFLGALTSNYLELALAD